MKRFVWLGITVFVVLHPQITQAHAQVKTEAPWESFLGEARGFAEKGHLEPALELLIRSLRAAEESGAAAESVAIVMNDLGTVYHNLGRHSDAERVYSRAIRVLNAHDRSTHPVMSRILDNQASLYMDFGRRLTQVERLRRRALELRIAEVGPEGPGIATLLSNLGSVCLALERFEEAERLFRRALDLAETTGTQGATTLGSVLQNLAVLYGTVGRYTEAADFIARAVASLASAVGDGHPDLVRPLLNQAQVEMRLNRPLVAEVAVRRAQQITETRLGPEHPLMLTVLLIHEKILRRTNRQAEAREAKRRAALVLASNPDLRRASRTVDLSELLENSRGRRSRR